MSKRNSTQPDTRPVGLSDRLLDRWAVFCIRRPRLVVGCAILFALAGYMAAYLLWFGYDSPVSRLPRNHRDRLAWEETSRAVQFNSEIFLRVTVPKTATSSDGQKQHRGPAPASTSIPTQEQRLEKVINLLEHKLSGNKKHFCDILSTHDLQVRETRQLHELSHDELQMLSAELLDARAVMNGQWSRLESANYVEWLATRLQQNQINLFSENISYDDKHASWLQSRRLLESTDRFTQGLHAAFNGNILQGDALISPWLLDPDSLCAQTGMQQENSPASTLTSEQGANTAIVWVKLSDPQLAKLLDRRVVGKMKKIDHKLLAKLDTSISELRCVVDDVSQKCEYADIEAFGVPIDVHQSRHPSSRPHLPGILAMLVVLSIFFVAGIGHFRVFAGILISTACVLGGYFGFCAIWFETIRPQTVFAGIFVVLLAMCTGFLHAVTYFDNRYRGLSVSDAIVQMVKTTGKSVFRGMIIAAVVFLVGVLYLWFFPVDPSAATLSFRSSLTGINFILFLILQGILACMTLSLGLLPALFRIVESDFQSVANHRKLAFDGQASGFTLLKNIPSIPLGVNMTLLAVLIAIFIGLILRHDSRGKPQNSFVTVAEKRAAALPVLVPLPVFIPEDAPRVPGVLAYDASLVTDSTGTSKNALLDDMIRTTSYSSDQQKITIPSQKALHQSLVELYRKVAEEHDLLAKRTGFEKHHRETLARNLMLCRNICRQIELVCQQLSRLSQTEYCERIDAWQQAVASDMLIQQKRLQTRLHHSRHAVQAETPAVTRRFRNENNQPLLWLFPTQSWQSVVQQEQSQAMVIDLLTAQKASWKVPPEEHPSQWGGFPLLVLIDHAWAKKQLPSLLAVMTIAFLSTVTLLSRSVMIGAMTMLTFIYATVLYGLAIAITGMSLGNATFLPLVFFPLLLSLYHDMFRWRKTGSSACFQSHFNAVLTCMGTGIIIVGHLLLSHDPTLFVMGRVMVLGWASLMFSLLFNLTGLGGRQTSESVPVRKTVPSLSNAKSSPPQTRVAQAAPFQSSRESVTKKPAKKPTTVIEQRTTVTEQLPLQKKPAANPAPTPNDNATFEKTAPIERISEKQPQAQATKDQLDFYRERIEATGVFDLRNSAPQSPKSEPPTQTAHATESLCQPEFPSVWSVGTKRRRRQSVIVRQADETHADDETAISCASHHATGKDARVVLKAQKPQHQETAHQPGNADFADESPMILPIHEHGNHTSGHVNTDANVTHRRRHA